MKQRIDELAPCGVFCGACPSFKKTCFGCSSEDTDQKRKSKWNCKIRNCCYNEKNVNYCAECIHFPCSKLKKKLTDSHVGDKRYAYRHEIANVHIKFREMETKEFLELQQKRWSCPYCGAVVHFYYYKCSKCGQEVEFIRPLL